MFAHIRSCLAVALALCLALASVSHALTRHQAAGAHVLVICTGDGLVRITLDAQGNPVEQQLPCPDCILSLSVPAGNVADGPEYRAVSMRVMLSGSVHPGHVDAWRWPQPRAPPRIG